MAKVRVVNTRFWIDDYISNLDPIEKLMFLYLLTNPMTDICGIYEVPLKIIAVETGVDKEMVIKILGRFERDGKVFYENGWVGIKNFQKHQSLNPTVVRGIQYGLEKAPKSLVNRLEHENASSYVPPKSSRKKIKLSTRKKVIDRDGMNCKICGQTVQQQDASLESYLEIDHIIPVKDNGNNDLENLRVACRQCNASRNGKRQTEYRWTTGGLSHLNPNSNPNSNIKAEKIFSAEGASIIKAFEEVNPKCKSFYNNRTQRKSCEKLIENYGLEKTLQVISILPKTNIIPYIPNINTPVQLEDKWSQLESALKKKKVEQLSKKSKIAFT